MYTREMIQFQRGGLGGHGGSFASFAGFNFLVFFFGRVTSLGSGVGAAPSFTFYEPARPPTMSRIPANRSRNMFAPMIASPVTMPR